jgi:hypothetical protein
VTRLGEIVMILDLHRQGAGVSAIARRTGLDRKTVRKVIAGGLEPPISMVPVNAGCCVTRPRSSTATPSSGGAADGRNRMPRRNRSACGSIPTSLASVGGSGLVRWR